MLISEDIILRIKEENDIVDVISDDVKLQRAGTNYKGLCPFHGEKTPSFTVSREKQIYKCFGCGEAGNVITYIMKTKNRSFPEACRYLADRVGIEIQEFRKEKDVNYEKKKRLYKLNTEAARLFYYNLRKNSKAQKYFLDRGIKEKTLKKFGLGFSNDSWNDLLNVMKGKGFSEQDLLEAGLISKSKKGTYFDKFRNRIMFPVFDVKGNVIGFGGRVLDDSLPKYLNSPETLVFKKGTNLYGLNFAIKSKDIRDRRIVIVEGYMDFLSIHQSGITNVAASLGTAFTPEQAKLLKRYVDVVVLCFDSDDAGKKAAARSIEILKQYGFEIKILRIPDGKDPDEFLMKHSTEEFKQLLDNACSLMEYRIIMEGDKFNLKTQDGKLKFLKATAKILAKASPIEQEIYVKKISAETGINEQKFYDQINSILKFQNKNINIRNENGRNSQNLYLEPAYLKAEKSLLNLMLKKEFYYEIMEKIKKEEFNDDIHVSLIELLGELHENNIENKIEYIEGKTENVDVISELIRIKEINIKMVDDEKEAFIDNCIKEIKKYNFIQRKNRLIQELKESEKIGDIDKCMKLAMEIRGIDELI
ncbi:DNA primase [Oceanirhabdus sp. W0125-5]|uniref:DNA primase n=1 Tax=Oceanirhabdus sp. W0125-5 TaxID=2999116 RepID=UPI0022F2EC67|nr:DNA primase [Oceanirhabdus sp. W0125-5]WBW99785.1 DNA primase [Oceanirhabdus sp. W0125-5]